MKKLLMAIAFMAFCCSVMGQPIAHITATENEAIEKAIVAFLKCRLSKKYSAFSVGIYEKGEYDRYEINDDLIVIEIAPADNADTTTWSNDMVGGNITYHSYYITLADTLGSTRLPTRHIIKDGKLFYWRDSNYGLTYEMIDALLEYNIAEQMDIPDMSYLGLMGKNQDFIKGAVYYFCKNNLSNYRRVITSAATGWYKPPMVRCKR